MEGYIIQRKDTREYLASFDGLEKEKDNFNLICIGIVIKDSNGNYFIHERDATSSIIEVKWLPVEYLVPGSFMRSTLDAYIKDLFATSILSPVLESVGYELLVEHVETDMGTESWFVGEFICDNLMETDYVTRTLEEIEKLPVLDSFTTDYLEKNKS